MQVGKGCIVATLAAVGACSAPRDPAAEVDAQPYCGDGVPNLGPDQPDVGWESCDDGALNGTTDSLCTRQCKTGKYPGPFTYKHLYLGFQASAGARATGDWVRNASHEGWAFIAADGSGIVIAPDVSDDDFTPIDDPNPVVRTPLVHITTAAAPVAIGSVETAFDVTMPIWVERPRPGESSPRMYYATVDADLIPAVHEVPYPFPDGTAPELYTDRYFFGIRPGVLLVDQSSAPPYDLLVATIVVRSPTDVTASVLRVPAPGRVRGAAVVTTEDGRPTSPGVWVERLVQFFEDTGTFVAIVDRPPPGVEPDETRTFEIEEFARGNWPYRVVTGMSWQEGCDDNGATTGAGYEFVNPGPIALLTDTGDIYTVQLGAASTAEEFIMPYGHVAPSTRTLLTFPLPLATWSWDRDGTFVALVDSDCHDLHSTAMRPQRFPGLGPWTTMFPIGGLTSTYLVVDDWLVQYRRSY